jgi:hypothetical protein
MYACYSKGLRNTKNHLYSAILQWRTVFYKHNYDEEKIKKYINRRPFSEMIEFR